MTCIVGLVDRDGGIWMGGDSAVIDDETWAVRTARDPKVRRIGTMLVGASGELRSAQVVLRGLRPPKRSVAVGTMGYAMACADSIRRLLIDRGAGQKAKEQDKSESRFLLGFDGHLFVVEEDYDVHELAEPYAAIGAGADLALGAMFVLEPLGFEPVDRITFALRAAARFNASVREPFTYLHMPRS